MDENEDMDRFDEEGEINGDEIEGEDVGECLKIFI